MNNASIFAGGNSHIQRAGGGINDRCAADADFRRNQSIGRFGNRRNSRRRIDEAALPEWRSGATVSLKGIDAAVFSRHENNIMFGPGNCEIRYV